MLRALLRERYFPFSPFTTRMNPTAPPTAMTAACTAKLTPKPNASMPSGLLDAIAIKAMSSDDASEPKIWRYDVMMAMPWAMSSFASVVHA